MRYVNGVGWLLAVLLLLAAGGGCSSVTLREPLPRSSDAVEQARFEGEWVSGDQILYLRFGKNGIGQLAGVEWKNDQFQLEKGEFTLSKGTSNKYLSVRVQEKGTWQEGYFFVQYRFTEQGDLVVWLPEVTPFIDAINKGKLRGTVESGKSFKSAVITSPPAIILAFLDDRESGALFDYREPMIFKKLVLEHPRN